MPPGATSSAGPSRVRRASPSFAAVQKHIAILERAGLVTKVRIGRRKVVRTNVEGLRRARGLLDRYEELWRGRLDRMTALVTDAKEADA
jgi:DNA-binding MarR family transcriptional regulator